MYTLAYTLQGYQNKITDEQKNDIYILYDAVYKNDSDEIKKQFIRIMENILALNPTQHAPHRESDFSLIMLLVDGFNDDYKKWLEKTKRPWNSLTNVKQYVYLETYLPNRKDVELLLDKFFNFLEADLAYPYNELAKLLEDYKQKSDKLNFDINKNNRRAGNDLYNK